MNESSRQRTIRHLQQLHTVVAGIALTAAISSVFAQNDTIPIRVSLLPYFLGYLATLVPFYHGAMRHLDITYVEDETVRVRSGALMADWSLLFLEGCLLITLALLISRPSDFLIGLIVLLVYDVFWSFLAHLAFSPEKGQDRSEHKWASVNFLTAVVLISLAVFLDSLDGTNKPVETYRWVIVLTITVTRTIIDYWWGWKYYYPTGG